MEQNEQEIFLTADFADNVRWQSWDICNHIESCFIFTTELVYGQTASTLLQVHDESFYDGKLLLQFYIQLLPRTCMRKQGVK